MASCDLSDRWPALCLPSRVHPHVVTVDSLAKTEHLYAASQCHCKDRTLVRCLSVSLSSVECVSYRSVLTL